MSDTSLNNARRTLTGIVIAAALAALSLPAMAVEDGLGTNVVKNMRVKDGGTLTVGGAAITNWSDVSGNATDQTARNAAAAASNAAAAAQATATYASNTANTAIANAATADGKAVTADGKAVAAQGTADAAVTAAGVADGKAVAAQATATYASNTANTAIANAATADGKAVTAQSTADAATNGLTLKYDKAGGAISGNVTFGSNIVHAINSQLALDNAGSINPANVSVVKIAGASGAVTNIGIAPGAEGQVLTIIGTDDSKTVQIVATTSVVLTEGVDFTMGSNAVLQVIYTGSKWAEMHRATPN